MTFFVKKAAFDFHVTALIAFKESDIHNGIRIFFSIFFLETRNPKRTHTHRRKRRENRILGFEESIDRSKMMISTIIVTSSVFHPVANLFISNVRTHILTSTISAKGEEKF